MADLVPYSQAATTSLVSTLQNSDLMALAREDNDSDTGYQSKVTRVDTIAKKVVKETDYSDLQTTSKNPIGAINEVNTKASQFDNMTATASGSIATFSDGGDDIPVAEFECEIVAQQGSGTPSPSDPLAITGFSQADIVDCGLNIWQYGDLTVTTNQSLNVDIPVGTYNFSGEWVTNSGYDCLVIFYDENNTEITRSTFTRDIRDNKPYQFVTPCKRITFYSGDNYTHSNGKTATISNIMLKTGSSVADYAPYTGNLYTVAFGQTIYGGRLIYANGQWSIEATHGIVDLGSLDWRIGYDVNRFIASDLVGIIQPPTNNDSIADVKCSIYSPISINNMIANAPNNTIAVATSSNLSIFDNRYSSETDFKTAMNGIILVYELATPVIIPITSSTRVKTISGDNNIYSNTGDCELKYFTNKADSLAELIKAFVL